MKYHFANTVAPTTFGYTICLNLKPIFNLVGLEAWEESCGIVSRLSLSCAFLGLRGCGEPAWARKGCLVFTAACDLLS